MVVKGQVLKYVIVRAGIKVDIGTFADKIRVRVGTINKCRQDN